jgi:hypothetical protein
MIRATCAAAALVLSAAAIVNAQSRVRDTEFGRSEADWCRDAGDSDFCEVREETLPNINAIDVDARGNGGVSIRGWDRNDVHVRMRVTARARTRADAEALVKQTRLVTADGHIRTDGPRSDRDGGRRRGGRWNDDEWWAAS